MSCHPEIWSYRRYRSYRSYRPIEAGYTEPWLSELSELSESGLQKWPSDTGSEMWNVSLMCHWAEGSGPKARLGPKARFRKILRNLKGFLILKLCSSTSPSALRQAPSARRGRLRRGGDATSAFALRHGSGRLRRSGSKDTFRSDFTPLSRISALDKNGGCHTVASARHKHARSAASMGGAGGDA